MAKPGSGAAALIATGLAHDLSKRAKPLDQQRLDLERKEGMRCGGCKRRITLGFEFVVFVVVDVPGASDKLATSRTFACNGATGCQYAEQVALEANAMRPIEWAYLDEQRGERIVGAADPEMEFVPPVSAVAEGVGEDA